MLIVLDEANKFAYMHHDRISRPSGVKGQKGQIFGKSLKIDYVSRKMLLLLQFLTESFHILQHECTLVGAQKLSTEFWFDAPSDHNAP